MFLVETLLNLVIYLCNAHTEVTFTIYYYIYYCSKGKWYTYTDDQYCFSWSMPCLFVLISHHFKPLTEIKTNYFILRTNWGWSSQKIKNNKPWQSLLVLIIKLCILNLCTYNTSQMLIQKQIFYDFLDKFTVIILLLIKSNLFQT